MKNAVKEKENFIIRDCIHSDISFPPKYLRILNAKEFQKLNYIRQLSCEYMVFPTATQTRFAHSVGTYYVMGQILKRLETVLRQKGILVTERQKDLALCSALLHDLGHGPLSHTFERLFEGQSHEKWTLDILRSPSTEVHQCIVQEFSVDFLEDLLGIIGDEDTLCEDVILDLIRQLVSSQLDADRMDYLLRDSYFTSVTGGNYDLHRIIRSLEVEEREGRLQVCVSEKYLSSLEEYILGRYYMHKEVYQHTLKRQMEGILIKSFQRAKEVLEEGEELFCTPLMAKLLRREDLMVEEYIGLEDSVLFFHLQMWASNQDPLLARLCQSFINRKKFTSVVLSAWGMESPQELKNRINDTLIKKQRPPVVDWEKAWFYLENQVRLPLYDPTDDNIWILCRDGLLRDLSQVSLLLNASNVSSAFEKFQCYISFPIFRQCYGFDLYKELFD